MSFFKNLFSGKKDTAHTASYITSVIGNHWLFYTNWLKSRLPLYHSYLYPGAVQEEIDTLRTYFRFELPEELIELYRLNNGDNSLEQELPIGSFMGFEFLSIPRVIKEHSNYMAILEAHPDYAKPQAYLKSNPENAIRNVEFNPGWIPVFADASGNFIGIDLDPDINGTKGQVINFGRDENLRFQIATNLTEFLGFIKERIQSGKCDKAIVQEDDGGYSYGLHPQGHLLDSLRHIRLEGQD